MVFAGRASWVLASLLLVASCNHFFSEASAEPVAAGPSTPLVTITPAAYDGMIVNPERGSYVGMNLLSTSEAAIVRAGGHSLAMATVRLDNYRDRPLDGELLVQLAGGFSAARANGIKVILRFTYNAAYQADASKAQILQHIAQLAPLLQANSDVIAVLQAGFIGAWGEWHHSTNGLDNNADRADILNALLKVLPANRSVQVRRPMFKASLFSSQALDEKEAYSGSARARVGHHNDCFLAGRSDSGTYARPVSTWKQYLAADGRFTPVGGETCTVSRKTDCDNALAELARHHWSFLNEQHDEKVIAEWHQNGCWPEIANRLGYRFVLKRIAFSPSAHPGGEVELELDVANVGFAAPFNPRPAYLVLTGGGKRQLVRLESVDVRRWAPGEVTRISSRLQLPADLPAGAYRLSLWLPDEAQGLRNDPRFAVRLANDGVWDEKTGENVLASTFQVVADAPGVAEAAGRSR
jgi:Domain of unknown function (DUF4832)/Domain of unknown function (DUF4874)